MEEEGVKFVTNVNVGVDITAEELLKEFDRVILLWSFKSERYQGSGKRCKGNLLCSGFPEKRNKESSGFQILKHSI